MPSAPSSATLDAEFRALGLRAATSATPPCSSTVLLNIGDEHLDVLSGTDAARPSRHRLDLGAARIARDYFRHDPPTPHEIELAIDFVEDQLMRLGQASDAGAMLWSSSAALRDWATVAGPTVSVETVETWFERLAAAAQGQASAMEGLPTGRFAAASLLLLREFMHHRSHPSISFIDPGRHT